jgi:hypothetical protein
MQSKSWIGGQAPTSKGRLQRQKETTASVTSSGIDRLKAVKVLSNDQAIGYNKHIKSLKLQHATLKKHSTADKRIATTKWAARGTIFKDQLKTATTEQKDCRKEAKLLATQLRKQDHDLAKTFCLASYLDSQAIGGALCAHRSHPRA